VSHFGWPDFILVGHVLNSLCLVYVPSLTFAFTGAPIARVRVQRAVRPFIQGIQSIQGRLSLLIAAHPGHPVVQRS